MELEPVADLAAAEALLSQRDRLPPEPLEIRVLAGDFRHGTSVVRNPDARVEWVVDSPFRAIVDRFVSVRTCDVLSGSPENEVRPPVRWMP